MRTVLLSRRLQFASVQPALDGQHAYPDVGSADVPCCRGDGYELRGHVFVATGGEESVVLLHRLESVRSVVSENAELMPQIRAVMCSLVASSRLVRSLLAVSALAGRRLPRAGGLSAVACLESYRRGWHLPRLFVAVRPYAVVDEREFVDHGRSECERVKVIAAHAAIDRVERVGKR